MTSEGQFSATAHYKALLEIGDRIKVSSEAKKDNNHNTEDDGCDGIGCEQFNYMEIFLMQKL